jgi:hypothetical protein
MTRDAAVKKPAKADEPELDVDDDDDELDDADDDLDDEEDDIEDDIEDPDDQDDADEESDSDEPAPERETKGPRKMRKTTSMEECNVAFAELKEALKEEYGEELSLFITKNRKGNKLQLAGIVDNTICAIGRPKSFSLFVNVCKETADFIGLLSQVNPAQEK